MIEKIIKTIKKEVDKGNLKIEFKLIGLIPYFHFRYGKGDN